MGAPVQLEGGHRGRRRRSRTRGERQRHGLFPARATGVGVEKISSAVLDLFGEGGADDVQLVASTAHGTARTRATVAALVNIALRGHEDFEHQAGYGDYSSADVDAAPACWCAVQQLAAELTRHLPQS